MVNHPIPPTRIKKNNTTCPNTLNCCDTVTVDSPVSENADADMKNASMNSICSTYIACPNSLYPEMSPMFCANGAHSSRAPTNENSAYQNRIFFAGVIFLKKNL